MKTRGLVFAFVLLAVSLALAVPTLGSQEEEDIIIEGADAVATRSTGPAFTSPVPLEPRFIMERADKMATVEVSEVPPDFPLALQPRFIVERLDRMVSREVAPVPPEMPRTLQPRFIQQRADAARGIHLTYPCELVGDEAPPVISLSPLEVEGDSATVRWQTNEYADSLLEYGLVPGSYSETVYDPWYTKSHEFTLSGLELGTTYYFQVTSTDRCGHAASDNGDWHITGPPAPPSNLQATTISASQIDITWQDNSFDESEFRIERSPDPECISGWTEIGSVPADTTAYSDVGLSCSSAPYCYRARAYRESDEAYSEYSNVDSAATKPCAPSNLQATPVSASQIEVTWDDNSTDESEFRIERSLNGISGWTEIGSVPTDTTIYSNTGLSCSSELYYYRVCAYREGDEICSEYSNTDSAATKPCAPSDLSAIAVSRTEIALTWQDNSSDETLFYIEQSLNGSTGWEIIASVPADTIEYSSAGLHCGTTYYYRVCAYRESDEICSEYSNVADATTLECYKIYVPIVLRNDG